MRCTPTAQSAGALWAAGERDVIALGKAQRILPGESPGREGEAERFPCKG